MTFVPFALSELLQQNTACGGLEHEEADTQGAESHCGCSSTCGETKVSGGQGETTRQLELHIGSNQGSPAKISESPMANQRHFCHEGDTTGGLIMTSCRQKNKTSLFITTVHIHLKSVHRQLTCVPSMDSGCLKNVFRERWSSLSSTEDFSKVLNSDDWSDLPPLLRLFDATFQCSDAAGGALSRSCSGVKCSGDSR